MYASAAVELTPDHTENHSGKSNSGRHAGSEEKGVGSFFGKAGIVSVHETVHGTVKGSPGNQWDGGRYQEYSNRCFDHAGDPACLGADPEISSIYGGNDTGGNRKYICPLRPVCQADPADGILHPSYLCAADQQLFTNRHSTI